MSFLYEIKTHKYRAFKTFLICLAMAVNGMVSALPGTTLLDLQIGVKGTLDMMAMIIPAHSVGYIIGATACGILVEYIDYQIMVIVSQILLTFVFGYFPWNQSLINILLNSCFNGILCGFINTGGNTWLIGLWALKAPAFLQAYHFSFGVGAFVIPLIAEPYLLPLQSSTNNTNTTINYTFDDLKIQYPYAIVSLYNFATVIVFIITYCIKRDHSPHPTECSENERKEKYPASFTVRLAIVLCTSIFMFFYYGLELSFGQLLTAYVVNCDLKLSKSTASFMTSLYWATFTFFRCFVIFLVDIFTSQTILIIDLALVLASNILLTLFSNNNELMLWIAIALMGFGTSPIFAAIFGFLQDVMHVSSKLASLVYVSCSTGTFVIPYVIGNYVDTYPDVFIYISALCGTMCSVLFAAMVVFKTYFIPKKVNE